MWKRSFIFLFVALTACASAPLAQPEAPAETVLPVVIGESRTIQSKIMGDERVYNVWLPPSYSEGDKRYPVVYLLDGGVAQDFHHISGLAQLGSVVSMFQEVIVVGVESKDRRAEFTYPSTDPADIKDFPTHGHSDTFRAFLTEELIPDVEARYRTNGDDALIAESLAAFFIVDTFLKAPDTVGTYIAISPSLWWDYANLGKGAAAYLQKQPIAERKLYLAIADEGGAMREGMLALVDALKKEKVKGLNWTFSDRPDLGHGTIYHREALDALIWAFPNPTDNAE